MVPSRVDHVSKEACPEVAQLEIIEEEDKRTLSKKGFKSHAWRIKPKADDQQDSSSSAAPINMVFMMPREFMASADSDEESELEEALAQLALEPVPPRSRNQKTENAGILKLYS
jgi:hypothetical protein